MYLNILELKVCFSWQRVIDVPVENNPNLGQQHDAVILGNAEVISVCRDTEEIQSIT